MCAMIGSCSASAKGKQGSCGGMEHKLQDGGRILERNCGGAYSQNKPKESSQVKATQQPGKNRKLLVQ